nr:serine/threonine-protein phosphatase 7 long form homolog isoform X1 [Ipomoea batatas]
MSRGYLHLGPIDSSLLTFQVHHRSESVWANAGFNSILNCAHYASAVFRLVVTDDRIERLLRQSVFYAVTRLGYMKLDHHLITALVERCRPEVHAFHLPFGEVRITLQDVEVLLGLKVDGRPAIGKIDQSIVTRFEQIENLLGSTPTANDHYPDRVCRQFDGYQEIPLNVEYDQQLHKYDGRQRSEQWDIFHNEYVLV